MYAWHAGAEVGLTRGLSGHASMRVICSKTVIDLRVYTSNNERNILRGARRIYMFQPTKFDQLFQVDMRILEPSWVPGAPGFQLSIASPKKIHRQ